MTDRIDTTADNITIPDTTETEGDKKKRAYSKATTRLRAENPALWNAVLKDEYAKVGINWDPKPTEEEKAKAQIESLLQAHPDLRSVLAHGH